MSWSRWMTSVTCAMTSLSGKLPLTRRQNDITGINFFIGRYTFHQSVPSILPRTRPITRLFWIIAFTALAGRSTSAPGRPGANGGDPANQASIGDNRHIFSNTITDANIHVNVVEAGWWINPVRGR